MSMSERADHAMVSVSPVSSINNSSVVMRATPRSSFCERRRCDLRARILARCILPPRKSHTEIAGINYHGGLLYLVRTSVERISEIDAGITVDRGAGGQINPHCLDGGPVATVARSPLGQRGVIHVAVGKCVPNSHLETDDLFGNDVLRPRQRGTKRHTDKLGVGGRGCIHSVGDGREPDGIILRWVET